MNTMLKNFQSIRQFLSKNFTQFISGKAASSFRLKDAEVIWDTIEACLQSNKLTHLDFMFEKWSISHPQFDIETTNIDLGKFYSQVYQITTTTICTNFDRKNSVELLTVILPILSYGIKRIIAIEVQNANTIYKQQLEVSRNNIEQFERNKSKFTTIAAHELKTPLTIIDGYVFMLNDRIDQNMVGNIEILEGIRSGVERLKVIVNDLIDVSLIDNRMLELSLQPVWLNRLFSAITEENKPVLEARHINLQIIKFDGSDEMFMSDPERLMQIFKNIIQNAIKFTPDQGKITISGRKLSEFIEVSISDTGIGIDIEHQMIIFDKYNQVGEPEYHSSGRTKFKGGGPGLGLHITKGLLEAMGGTIWVESPGYDEENYPGSTFHVLIPLDQNKSRMHLEKLQGNFH